MTSEAARGAVGKSISFRPYSVYTDAVAFGRLQSPPRSISVVVCEALENYLEQKGFRNAERRQLTELMPLLQELGLEEAMRILKRATRRRLRRKKRGART